MKMRTSSIPSDLVADRVKVSPYAIKDPRSLSHRIIVIVLMCLLSFGSYFCNDNLSALHEEFINDLNINEETFMSFYAWYSWPNVVLCFFGGFLVDNVFGVRLGCLTFSVLVFIGQIIISSGVMVKSIWLISIGRLTLGVGAESLCTARNKYAVIWFKGKELKLVFGLQLSMARIGSTVNMNVMNPIYNMVQKNIENKREALGISLFLAALTCVLSLICAAVLGYLDKRAEKLLDRTKNDKKKIVKFTDVKDFSIQVWLIFFICLGYYVSVLPFVALGTLFFEHKFGFSSSNANAANSIVYLLSVLCSPVFGLLLDIVGKDLSWIILAVIILQVCHATLTFTFITPWFAMVLMGFSFSIVATALWPLVAVLVPEHQLGTAYGLMQSVQNLGLAAISVVAGSILDNKGYFMLEIFFCMCVGVALISSLSLYILDFSQQSGLNANAKKQVSNFKTKNQTDGILETFVERRESIKPVDVIQLRNRK